jgi:hypothetical protein
MSTQPNRIWFEIHGGRAHKPMPVSPVVSIKATTPALSPHLMTASEIDDCVDSLKADLEAERVAAKRALAAAA